MPFGMVLHGVQGTRTVVHAIKSDSLRFYSRRAFRFTPRVRVGRDGFGQPGEASESDLCGTLNFFGSCAAAYH